MLVKKKVMLLHDLEDNGIDYVKEVCGYDFIQKLSDIYYTHSTDDKNKSDWVITTTNLMNLSQEISFDPNLIKFEINLSFDYLRNLYSKDIQIIDKEREKRSKEKYEAEPQSPECAGYGWRTIQMQLDDLKETKRDCIQIKIFTVGKRDYYCYIV